MNIPTIRIKVHDQKLGVIGQGKIETPNDKLVAHVLDHIIGNLLRQIDLEAFGVGAQVVVPLVDFEEVVARRRVHVEIVVGARHELQVEVAGAGEGGEGVFGGGRGDEEVDEEVVVGGGAYVVEAVHAAVGVVVVVGGRVAVERLLELRFEEEGEELRVLVDENGSSGKSDK